MEKSEKIIVIGFIVCLCAALLFCGLWLAGRQEKYDMQFLCAASAGNCLEALQEYQNTQQEGNYWRAVAEFRTYSQSYVILIGEFSTEYTWLTDLYAYLTVRPEIGQENAGLFLEAMEYISHSIHDDNGFDLLYELKDTLEHAEAA